jgi:hypothetical protein
MHLIEEALELLVIGSPRCLVGKTSAHASNVMCNREDFHLHVADISAAWLVVPCF